MSTQKLLFKYNRERVDNPLYYNQEVLDLENNWIQSRIDECSQSDYPLNWQHFQTKFNDFIENEKNLESSGSEYVANNMSLDEFRVLVQEFAIDGLTEAQVFYYILPRLPLEAQMPMLRIMIDEFGSGNFLRAHTSLYVNLLNELEMPVDYWFYSDLIDDASYEFVNLFYWLTLRADQPSYFCGALAYLESIIPTAFECYVQCCFRLNIKSHLYYSEHQHIDFYHAQEGIRVLKALDSKQFIDYEKAWQGVLLASHITNHAFEGAVNKARKEKNSIYLNQQECG